MINRDFRFETGLIRNNILWFVTCEKHGLFRYDLDSEELKFITFVDGQEGVWRLVGAMEEQNNSLVMAPFTSDYFYSFDMNNNSIEKRQVSYEGEFPYCGIRMRFWCAIKKGEDVFFVGHTVPYIIKINHTGEATLISSLPVDIKENLLAEQKPMFRYSYAIVDDEILIPSSLSNYILILDTKTDQTSFIKIGQENERLMCICQDGDELLCISVLNNVFRLEQENGTWRAELTCIHPEEDRRPIYCYLINKELYVFDNRRNDVEIINIENGKNKVVEFYEGASIIPQDRNVSKICWMTRIETGFMAYLQDILSLVRIDSSGCIDHIYSFKLSNDSFDLYTEGALKMYKESVYGLGLKEFMNWVRMRE